MSPAKAGHSLTENPLYQDFIDVAAVDSGVALGLPDDAEALAQVGLQGCLVVGPHIGEEFLVTLPARGLERCREQLRGNALSAAIQIDERADDAHVIEGGGEVTKRRDVLQPDHAIGRAVDRDEKNAAPWKGADEMALFVNRELRVERGVDTCRDDRIEDRHHVFGVLDPGFPNLDHALLQKTRRSEVFFSKEFF